MNDFSMKPPNPRNARDMQAKLTASQPKTGKPLKPRQGGTITRKIKRLMAGRKRFKLVLGVLSIALIIGLLYGYIQTRNELKRVSDPQSAMRQEAEALAEDVGKFLDLPKDETPSVATVKDENQLQGLLFFERAEKGDKVLIYSEAKRAVLYRPTTKKVIEYAPVESTAGQ
jgi:hypothetical protein